MPRAMLCSVFAGLLLSASFVHAQGAKTLIPSEGFGSLSGKVTFVGEVPAPVDLTALMMKHNDKACCLDPKAKEFEKIDPTWLVDKNKGVANVMIWVKVPANKYLATHEKLKVRKEEVVIDQPHCAFLPRMSAFQPFYIDDGKEVATGQKMIIKNSASVPHNIRATGNPLRNPGFNKNLPPMTELDISKDLKTQPLPINLQCDFHPWMAAKLFVFDHPYYAITKTDGTYEIPYVPAGAEITLMAWHEGVGYVTTNKGVKTTLKTGKNTQDFELKK